MKKIIIKATCISALLLSTQGWCGNTSVDLRFGHNIRSDVNDSRIKVMHQANNGFYFSVEAAQNHNDTFFGDTDRYNPDDKGLTEAAQEIETRWRFDLGNGFAVAPGMVTVFTASNTHYRPFIQGWKAFDNGLNLSARYRYNTVNDAHSDKELDGSGYTRRQSHQFDIWFAYNIGKFGMSYNPRFRWQDNVDQGTGDDTYWEHTVAFNYKLDDGWTPYVELVSLDKTYINNDGNHENDYAVRLGIVKQL
ncbi:TPA: hypothetical protein QHJ63_002008 [Enterobacter hormaechei subsp. steigerwaltii]|nr:hypothetical protein [Enterobacter hormaechei subsp. steigerwaltii]HEO9569239.1 hypothetical protein [Enterobacter hormaechei subsp. steigerwaltii]